MIELFGLQLGTLFQGGTLAAMLAVLAIVARTWIMGIPDRARAGNEGKVTAAAELSERYRAWRQEIHDLRNDVQVVTLEQARSRKALAEAHAINLHNESQISTMLFLIRLLISELKQLAPGSIIVAQAEMTIKQMGHDTHDPSKSASLNAAEDLVKTAEIMVDEIKHSESGK